MSVIPPILALVLAGGRSEGLHALGRVRTASALPYGGKYRVIDFTLSNCIHSGLTRIGILTPSVPWNHATSARTPANPKCRPKPKRNTAQAATRPR